MFLRISWHRKLQFGLLLHSLLFFASASSELVNITVDDQLGDSITGLIPEYLPDDVTVWHVGSPTENCPTCDITPATLDVNQIHGKTWHDATPLDSPIPTTITVHFTGSAVYVFNILPNNLPRSPITLANITFSIDGSNPYTFLHRPVLSSEIILYDQLVYHNEELEDGPHSLTMTVGHFSLILFDYLLYTQSNNTTSSSTTTSSTSESTSFTHSPSSQSNTPMPTPYASSRTPVGAIVGAVVGGVALLFGVAFGAFLLGRRRTHSAEPTQLQQGYRAFPGMRPVDPDATSTASPSRASCIHDTETHDQLERTSNASGQVTPRPSPIVTDGALTAVWSTNRRPELTQLRLGTLQRTRSILSSPSLPNPSQLSSESRTERAIQGLEAEITELRGVLTTLNVRLADCSRDGQLEPLPEYME